jgi:hypothetical protein
MPTAQEIQSTQGTRLSEAPPWETYAKEMDQKVSPALAEAITEYSKRQHDVKPSSQNVDELARQKELNQGVAQQYQWLDPAEYEYEAPRVGRVLHSSQFITKLRANGIACWYRDHPHADKLVLVYTGHDGNLAVGCWAANGYMPEYEFVRFDERGVVLDTKRRGWRTCLLQLIMKGVITEEKANKAFGRATGPASARYLSTLFSFRSRDKGWEQEGS